jgi:DNA adenine methylase
MMIEERASVWIDPAARLTPFLKWPGGKGQELIGISAAAPPLSGRLIDPFVGGGSILLATPVEVPAVANDACRDLIELYVAAARGDLGFRQAVDGTAAAWAGLDRLDQLYVELADAFSADAPELTESALAVHAGRLRFVVDQAGHGLASAVGRRIGRDIPAKFDRMRRLQSRRRQLLSRPDLLANVEGGVRAVVYTAVRSRYNAARLAGRWDELRSADFLFLRELAYAAMFRFNSRDEFNVPYGGISYNRKSLTDKASLLFGEPMLARLATTEFHSQDFETFLDDARPTRDDFVFVDPPYDSDFSAYDNRPFGAADQIRLERVLAGLPARVMVVIKDAPAIRSLYAAERWRLVEAPKTYMWTIKSRNDRLATHLTITNYGSIRANPATKMAAEPYAPKTRWTSSSPAARASTSSVVE